MSDDFDEDLHSLSEQELYGEDLQADLEHWSRTAYWTLEEATALSFGKDPQVVNWSFLEKYRGHPIARDYAKRRELFLRAQVMGILQERNQPAAVVAWAKS